MVPLLVVVLLGISAGCNFERRPPTQVNADPGRIQTTVPDESATTFLEDFQSARSGSGVEPADLRPFLHPEATVIVDGLALPVDAGADDPTDAWEVLTRLPGDGADPSTLADSGVFEGSAFFVVRYGAVLETFFLARDSVGWGLRLLQRVDEDG